MRNSAAPFGPCSVLFIPVLFCVAFQVQRLQGRCEQQERQLKALRDELRKTSLGLEAFIVTTQHYCLKVANWNDTVHSITLITILRLKGSPAIPCRFTT